jgi:hypothetical protein
MPPGPPDDGIGRRRRRPRRHDRDAQADRLAVIDRAVLGDDEKAAAGARERRRPQRQRRTRRGLKRGGAGSACAGDAARATSAATMIPAMHFALPEDHRLVRPTLHGFAEALVAPVAEELDRNKRFPYDLARQLGDLNLIGIPSRSATAARAPTPSRTRSPARSLRRWTRRWQPPCAPTRRRAAGCRTRRRPRPAHSPCKRPKALLQLRLPVLRVARAGGWRRVCLSGEKARGRLTILGEEARRPPLQVGGCRGLDQRLGMSRTCLASAANICSMTSAGHVPAQLQRAIASGNLLAARALARELPRSLNLDEALGVLLLIADAEPHTFPRAAARFVGRFALERPLLLRDVKGVASALLELPAPFAYADLRAVCERHRIRPPRLTGSTRSQPDAP